MTDRSIIFSGPMVRALMEGRKTQTRRLPRTKDLSSKGPSIFAGGWDDSFVLDPGNAEWREACYPWRFGDRLWVKETWGHDGPDLDSVRRGVESDGPKYGPYYFADADWFNNATVKKVVSIHMPRLASRLTLIVTDVRVQRLQDIREADAMAEGAEAILVPPDGGSDPHVVGFCKLWDSIHGAGASWDANPWIVALTFEVHKANIDSIPLRPALSDRR